MLDEIQIGLTPNVGLHQLGTLRGILKSTITRVTKLNNEKGEIISSKEEHGKERVHVFTHQILRTFLDKSFLAVRFALLRFCPFKFDLLGQVSSDPKRMKTGIRCICLHCV